MPIHCFMRVQAILEPNQLELDLTEIIAKRFNNLLTIERHNKPGEICDWTIAFDPAHNFPVCLKNPNQIELIRPDDIWAKWAQLLVEDILAIKYGARILDEEYPRREIKPDLAHHSTFLIYLEQQLHHHSLAWKEALINIQMANLPFELRCL